MIFELIIFFISLLIICIVNKYSVVIALVLCICLAFYSVRYCSRIITQRIITHRFAELWIALTLCFSFIKHIFCFCRRLIPLQNHSHSNSTQFSGKLACGQILTLESEIDELVHNITQFYIHSWYNKISGNEDFILYLKDVIKNALLKLGYNLTSADKNKFVCVILQLYLHFFSHFVEVKKTFQEFNTKNFQMKHWAMKDSVTEWCYLQSLMSAILDKFGPLESSLHSKYSPLLHTIIVEILTETVIQPLVKLLSDPLRINVLVLKILLIELKINDVTGQPKSTSTATTHQKVNSTGENLPLNSTSEKVSVPDMCDTKETDQISSGIFNCDYTQENIEKDSISVSPVMRSSSNSYLPNFNFPDIKIEHDKTALISCDNSIKRSKSADFIRQMPQLKALNEKDYNITLKKESNTIVVAVKLECNSNLCVEQAEEAFAVEIPTLFTDVKIVDTFQQNEDGLYPYILYCIEYTAIFHDIGNSLDIPQFVTQVISIKRRFSEFVTLHSRLEDYPDLKYYLKGIKGPSKWLTLPFSNLDKKYIAERKMFLENYLKELCNLAPIAHSSELQEFLAYGGDARISFVKRTGDINVPRIDKFLVRGVKGAFDIFKTALPTPTTETEGIFAVKSALEDGVTNEEKFNEHLLDFSSREPEIKEHVQNYLQNLMEDSGFNNTSYRWKNPDSKIRKSSLLRNMSSFKTEKSCMCSETSDTFLEEEYPIGISIIEIIDLVVDFNGLSLGDLRTRVILLLAPIINRYMMEKIDSLSEKHLASALHFLHLYLWPSDISVDEPSSSQENISNLNKIIDCIEILFSSKYFLHNDIFSIKNVLIEKIKLFLLSIQNEETNKCLLFHIFDVLIEFVCLKD